MGETPLMSKPETKGKLVFLEALRIIACYFVIFNHTGMLGFFLFGEKPYGSFSFWLYLCISIFCKMSVPLFFAMSGALLLTREQEPLGVLWKKRILKTAVTLVFFSLLYYLVEVYQGDQPLDISLFFGTLYSEKWSSALWFLYAYIAFLVCLPFLRSLVKSLETKHFIYMFSVALFCNSIRPVGDYLLFHGAYSLNSHLCISWLSESIVLYPCLGYFLQHRLDIQRCGKSIVVLWIANIASILLVAYTTYRQILATGTCTQSANQAFHSCFVMINCATLFLTAKYVFFKIKLAKWLEKIIVGLGGCTFGVYLIHMLFLYDVPIFSKLWSWLLWELKLNTMLGTCVFCFIVMLVCCGITWVLKKIPVVKRLVGG